MATAQDSICKSSQLSSKMAEAREGGIWLVSSARRRRAAWAPEAAGRRFFLESGRSRSEARSDKQTNESKMQDTMGLPKFANQVNP